MINKRSSIISILLAILAIVFFTFQLPKVQFDYELENFFPIGDPDLAYYRDFSSKFGSDNDYILVGFKNNKGVFKTDFLQKVKSTVDSIKNLSGTDEVVSLTHLKKVVKSPMAFISIPYLHFDVAHDLSIDSVNLFKEKHLSDQFISSDGRSLKIIILHKKFTRKDLADEYAINVLKVLDVEDFDQTHAAGKIIAQTAYINAVQNDFSRFLVISGILVLIMLIIFIRKPSMIMTSLFISIVSVVVTLGIMALLGKRIDVLTTLIPSILLVVSMSDIIHLFAGIKSEWHKGLSLNESLNSAIRSVGLATFLTSFTTAVGFLTLISINVIPIRELGIYAAVGILSAFLLTYALFPQMILLIKPNLGHGAKQRTIENLLARLFSWVIKKRKTVLLFFGLGLGVITIGIKQLEINAFLIEDLPESDPVKSSFMFFDEQFGGTKPTIISLFTKDSSISIYSKDVIIEIAKIEDAAKQILETPSLTSPVTLVKMAHQILHGGLASAYKLPENEKDWKRTLDLVEKSESSHKRMKIRQGNQAQMSGFTKDSGSKISLSQNASFLKEVKQTIDPKWIDVKLTGTSPLIDKSHGLLSFNLIKGLLIAILIVGILAGFLFHSWRMVLITLVPNLLPILTTAAVMGFSGIPINLSTSIIFAISFGIVVDDTIHFLSKFRMVRKTGISNLIALKRTIIQTGEPIIITTIILTSGFSVFCFSTFGATFHTGLFVSISFVTALIADLTLLPVLIIMFLPEHNK